MLLTPYAANAYQVERIERINSQNFVWFTGARQKAYVAVTIDTSKIDYRKGNHYHYANFGKAT